MQRQLRGPVADRHAVKARQEGIQVARFEMRAELLDGRGHHGAP
jgi:hypothetical protein